MKFASALVVLMLVCVTSVTADTFGSGANLFDIEFVTVDNPGNVADSTGEPDPAGSVPYTYRIGKFEISEQMMEKARTLGQLGIDQTTRGPDKPVASISWNEAARFVNWLNTSTGNTPAYKFAVQPGEGGYSSNDNIELWTIGDAGYNPNNLYRNSLARYFLPSVDEWYKAAYYDPTNGSYFNYPTGSNSPPTAVVSGTAAGTAVYFQSSATGPADITLAGGLSPYGTMGQGGNVFEWEETDFDLVNGPTGSSSRGRRGGSWNNISSDLSSSNRANFSPTSQVSIIGFRVASIADESLAGDFDGDVDVDGRDFLAWQRNPSIGDLADWQANYGIGPLSALKAVPEPSTALLVCLSLTPALCRRNHGRL